MYLYIGIFSFFGFIIFSGYYFTTEYNDSIDVIDTKIMKVNCNIYDNEKKYNKKMKELNNKLDDILDMLNIKICENKNNIQHYNAKFNTMEHKLNNISINSNVNGKLKRFGKISL